jgi:hypothetical protein
VQHAGQSTQKSGLAEAGHALEQHVTSGKQANEYAIDDILLADDDLADLFADAV